MWRTEDVVAFICEFLHTKGGVGKTTMAAEVAAVLARLGVPTLVIDMDWQGDMTTWLGGTDDRGVPNFWNIPDKHAVTCLFDEGSALPDPDDVIFSYERLPNLMILPANYGLKAVEERLSSDEWPAIQQRLAEFILKGLPHIAAVLIDCPPKFPPGSRVALLAADHVVTPCTPSRMPVRSLPLVEQFMAEVAPHRAANRPPLNWLGILPTRVNARSGVHRFWLDEMQALYPTTAHGGVFPQHILEHAAYLKACEECVPLCVSHHKSPDAIAIVEFVVEMAQRARFQISAPLLPAKRQPEIAQEEVVQS